MPAAAYTNPSALSPRAREVVAAARELLESEGPDKLSMRRLGERLGISAPAFYRHFPDKRALENALIFEAFWEFGDVMMDALDGAEDPLAAVARAYRQWSLEHPHLYDLLYQRPLDREHLDPAAEYHTGEAIRELTGGDDALARTFWAFAHGMVDLELKRRFQPDSDLDLYWKIGLDGMRGTLARRKR